MMLVTCPRKVNFLIAEKSLKKPIIGHFSRAAGAIGVARPQDYAKRGEWSLHLVIHLMGVHLGSGRILISGTAIKGEGTAFTSLKPGDKIRPGKSAEAYRVNAVSDTEGTIPEEIGEASPVYEPQGVWLEYDILEHIDQVRLFIYEPCLNFKHNRLMSTVTSTLPWPTESASVSSRREEVTTRRICFRSRPGCRPSPLEP